MSSKQSCFKTVVKCDLKRSWWISALAALFIFMSTTSPLFNYSFDNDNYYYSRYDNALDFAEMMFGNYVIGMFVSAFVVLYLFSYVNKVNSVSFFHSLPATRFTLMSAHITSGAILVAFPMLINSLISFFAVGRGIRASWILVSLAMYLVYSFVIFSLTLVISMLTGVSIASGIFTLVVALLPLFVFVFVSELCSDYLYGFADFEIFEDALVRYVYLAPELLMTPKVLIYIALIAVFLVLSFFIYKKRHLENYGEVIAFPELKGLFKVLFGLCSGVLSYYYFEAFWNISSVLTMLVFGTLGTVIAHMLANKSISLKGALKPLLVTFSIILALFVSFFFDMFGYEKRIPELSEIEYVDIGGFYYEDYAYVDSGMYGVSDIRVVRKDPFVPHFKTKEEIQLFLDLHKYAVDHQEENDDWNDDFITPTYRIVERRYFEIEYTLKNGSVMKRSYDLPKEELEKYTSKIYSSDTYRKWKYPVLDGTEKTYKSVFVYDDRMFYDDEFALLSPGKEETKKLIEALIKDRENISYERMQANDYGSLMRVELNYTAPYLSADGKEYQVELSETYAVSKYDENTWALLEELDLFADSRKITAKDIESIDVYVDGYFPAEEAQAAEVVETAVSHAQMKQYDSYEYDDEDTGISKSFNEKEDIEILLNLYMNHHNDTMKKGQDYVSLSIDIYLKESNSRIRQIIIPIKDLPENLKFIEELYVK
ncbi:MAG: ABC transporter permease [Clostridia bacterium]|nr:ABC transporter permease [Clostridia bacterium]